jgi:hypothetical protein
MLIFRHEFFCRRAHDRQGALREFLGPAVQLPGVGERGGPDTGPGLRRAAAGAVPARGPEPEHGGEPGPDDAVRDGQQLLQQRLRGARAVRVRHGAVPRLRDAVHQQPQRRGRHVLEPEVRQRARADGRHRAQGPVQRRGAAQLPPNQLRSLFRTVTTIYGVHRNMPQECTVLED